MTSEADSQDPVAKRLVVRRLVPWIAALLVPASICLATVSALDRFLNIAGESAIFFVGVLVVALLGGIAPAAVAAVLSGLLLNFFLTEPRRTFRIADPDSAVTLVVMVVVAVAVAALVDNASKRRYQARRAAMEAELLAMFSGMVLRGADLEALLERVRQTYSQRTVTLVRDEGSGKRVFASVGEDPSPSMASSETTVAAGDDEFWLSLSGSPIRSGDQWVLEVVASQAAGLVRQHELAEEAGRAQAIEKADELRRALLTAVSHDFRTPLAGAKAAVSSLRADDIGFSEQDVAELLATVEESVDQLTALVDNLLDSSRLAAGAVRPDVRRIFLEEVVQRALVSISRGATGSGRGALDRVTVEVADAAVMADAGLLERVLANVIDNGLRHSGHSVVLITAAYLGDRTHTYIIDQGPGVPTGLEEQLFEPFQRRGDRDNKTGVGLGLSVARGFVEAMGGSMSGAETPGGGLTIVIDLAAPPDGAR